MSSAAVSTHSGAGPLGLMSCVRESSPPQDIGTDYEIDKNVVSKRKFWNPRKWFKRKPHKTPDDVINPSPIEIVEQQQREATARSRSASELSINEEPPKRRRSSNPISPGLSVSHDSVFPHSGSELELDAAKSTSSLSIHHQPTVPDPRLQTELTERLRLRRGRGDTSEDDEGLPRSPCNSPTTTDELLEKTAIKDLPTKSQSTCSDGSLLSMGSSEMDEDSLGHNSKNSSKSCLADKKTIDIDSDLELGPLNSLNHSAAHHKVAVRPKRTHGAPRRKRLQQINTMALPTTPEVNEDSSIRSLTPDANSKESVTELYAKPCMTNNQAQKLIQVKCSSLPPGLAGPGAHDSASKLNRSRSNAGTKSQDIFATLGEEEDDVDKKEKREDKSSFFGRIFPRKSGRKKKSKEERPNVPLPQTKPTETHARIVGSAARGGGTISIDSNLSIRPNALIRSGPAARQRVQPIDIPASPELNYRHEERALPHSPERHFVGAGTSPLNAELESHFRSKMSSTAAATPPTSPKLGKSTPPRSPIRMVREGKMEEKSAKIKLPALSSLQQRVLLLKDEPDDVHRSLDVIKPETPPKIIKSHSFKSTRHEETITKSKVKEELNSNKLRITTNHHENVQDHQHHHHAEEIRVATQSSKVNVSPEKGFKGINDKDAIKSSVSLDSLKIDSETQEATTVQKESKLIQRESKDSEKEETTIEKTSKISTSVTQSKIVESKREARHETKVYPIVLKSSELTKNFPLLLRNSETGEVTNVINEFARQCDEFKLSNVEEQKHEMATSKESRNETFATKSQMSSHEDQQQPDQTSSLSFSEIQDHIKTNKFDDQEEFNNFNNNKTKVLEDIESKASSSITISGPSHTAVVSVGNITSDLHRTQTESVKNEIISDDNHKEIKIKEQQISVTKIQLKRDTVQCTTTKRTSSTSSSPTAADFLNVHLNKVENKPTSNVILSTTPKIIDEQKKTKEINEQKHVKETTSQKLLFSPNDRKEVDEEKRKSDDCTESCDKSKDSFDEPKSLQQQSPMLENKRKFSADDIEIIENPETNSVSTAFITISTTNQSNNNLSSTRMFKKHSESQSCPQQRKSSLIYEQQTDKDEKPILRAKSCSLEMPTDAAINKICNDNLLLQTQKSLDDLDNNNKRKKSERTDNVILRRKMINSKKDEEPELMKVFARLSLKLKDNECDEISQQLMLNAADESANKSRDSDKENQSDSPAEERKRINNNNNNNVKETTRNKETTIESGNDVQLRRPINNKIGAFQRATATTTTVTALKNNDALNSDKVQRQTNSIITANDRPKTDGWTSKSNDSPEKRPTSHEDIVKSSMIVVDNDYINEAAVKPKNVNQRKAEWEKRAQEAKMKTMP